MSYFIPCDNSINLSVDLFYWFVNKGQTALKEDLARVLDQTEEASQLTFHLNIVISQE